MENQFYQNIDKDNGKRLQDERNEISLIFVKA